MSGIALIFRRDGGMAAAAVHERMLDALAHCGGDGRAALSLGPGLVVGHQHAWLTPEEVGERQPLVDAGGRWVVAFDGRLDNRRELATELGVEAAGTSDARLVLAAYERWGENLLPHLFGSFVLAIQDVWRRRVLLARDPMGERTVYYRLTPRELIVASEEAALLGHPEVSGEPDEESVARYFALRAPAPGRTLFREIHELRPGHLLIVEADGERQMRSWEPPSSDGGVPRSDDDWAEELLDALEQSVRCRLRGVTMPAVLMSGGLDSTTVAALAAAELAGRNERLRTVSWIFDELEECDESRFVEAMAARWGLDVLKVRGDEAWPLANLPSWPLDPGRAYADPYTPLVALAYRRARDAGHRVLLTGYWGDQLFSGSGWLRGLLAERRFGAAAGALAGWGWRHRRDGRAWRLAGTRAVGRLAGVAGPSDLWPALLTERSCRQLRAGAMPSPERAAEHGLLEGFHVWMATGRAQLARRLGIELSDPLRDRRLVELVLRMPAHQLQRGGISRFVLRRAMRGLLPDEVRRRPDKTSLERLFERGLEREAVVLREILEHPEASWRRFVRPHVVESVVASPGASHAPEHRTLAWMAVGFELWKRGPESPISTRLPADVLSGGVG